VVNDGSTDNSLDVVKLFAYDPRVRIIEQENQGVSAARNKGVACAKYDYVAFLDADDEWLPGFLEKIKEAIELFPNAAMYGTPSWHRNILTGQAGNTTLNRYKDKIQIAEYFENPHTMPHTSAMVVNKQYFNRIDNGNAFPVGMKLCEDWSCFNRLAFLAPFVYIGYPLGIRNNGVFGQITGLSAEENFKLYQHVVAFFNLTHRYAQQFPAQQKLFKLFFKYDLRNRILCAIRDKDYRRIDLLLTTLDADCLQELHSLEKTIYRQPAFNLPAKLLLYASKLIWRKHGFPIVGRQ
jgi:glycosyltransferase involved in cell wall biosynthesis